MITSALPADADNSRRNNNNRPRREGNAPAQGAGRGSNAQPKFDPHFVSAPEATPLPLRPKKLRLHPPPRPSVRLHSLLSRTAARKARRAAAMTAATVRPARTASLPPRARAQSRAAVQTTASAAVRMRPAMHSLHRPVPPERRAAAAAVPLLQGTKTRALCSSAAVRRSRSSRTLRSI